MEAGAEHVAGRGEHSSDEPEPKGPGPSPLVAFLLSAIWPGLGHIGHRNRRALVLAGATVVVAAVGLGYSLTRDVKDLLYLSVNRRSLWVLIGAALGLLIWRGAVAFDAYRVARRRHPPRRVTVLGRFGTLVTLAALTVLVAAPHLIVMRLATAQLTLLSEVFDASDTQTARPTPLPADTGETAPPPTADGNAGTADPTRTAEHAGTADQAAPWVAEDTATAPDAEARTPTGSSDTLARTGAAPVEGTPAAANGGDGRLTIALLGSDGGYGRTGVRTDTIIVLSIDTGTGDAAAFSIPRNWRHVSFPTGTAAADRWFDGYPGIANEIYGLGLRYPEAFPGVEDRAGHAVKSALAQLTGLEVHYYVMADMVGFVKVIDLFGGIELQVGELIEDSLAPLEADGPSVVISVEPGYQRLDGMTALGYVRSRAQTSDWHRMTRQRCVVGALIDQVTPLEALARFVTLTEIITEHVTTDIPLDRLRDLIAEADRLDTARIVTVNFIPPEFPRGNAPIPQVRTAVARALEGTANEANAVLSDACR